MYCIALPAWQRRTLLHAAIALALPPAGVAQTAEVQSAANHVTTLERVSVVGNRPASMPLEIPTTLMSLTGREIEQTINATDAPDALKYFPSLLVRKRYIGDYDHAVLATRASGTGNSARSLVYADGVLLSNLLGNGASFTPRWALVTPEEIERVDVLYGPFSAAYAGNSAGAIVDFVTRMPKAFEAHVKLTGFTQDYRLYGTDLRYSGGQGSGSIGSRSGDWSWWVNVNRLDSESQSIGFAAKRVADGTAGNAGTPVTGAVTGNNPRNQPWLVFGTTGQTHTTQDHAKFKLAYDFTPSIRASYTLGYWGNEAERRVESFVRDAAGNPVYSGVVNVEGRSYTLAATDLAPSQASLVHLTHGLSVKSHTRATWDWEVAASLYSYSRDQVRAPTVALPAALNGGAGSITDLDGTGWNTLALKGIWRPNGAQGEHIVEAGLQRDAFHLRSRVSTATDWIGGAADAAATSSTFRGDTTLQSLWAQDAWRFAPEWKAVLGARFERWQAFNGAINGLGLGERSESHLSPKAAVSFQASPELTLKTSIGRAVRMPTVSELYQGSVSANVVVNNDPNLKPEKSWTSELSAERDIGVGKLRMTAFAERTVDALYSQTNVTVTPNVTNIQNIGAIRTLGAEVALQSNDVVLKGLDLSGSVTYADSEVVRNDKFPVSVGKRQPRVPQWRATVLLSYAMDDQWSGSFGARYSGRQYGQLDNSDTNDFAYTGFSRYFVTDVRLRYRASKKWVASAGIDNLGNATYWAFHPYPQRTFMAELRYDH
jgi:iron complex outermembrane recepter protein